MVDGENYRIFWIRFDSYSVLGNYKLLKLGVYILINFCDNFIVCILNKFV